MSKFKFISFAAIFGIALVFTFGCASKKPVAETSTEERVENLNNSVEQILE